ncbi:hypothetical protein AHAS_Ahas15G0241300 [Arachis hypogaea]
MGKAMHETTNAATKAVNHLGEKNGNNNNNSDPDMLHNDRPMALASFLKVNPPKFKGKTIATETNNWFCSIERSLQTQHVPEGQSVRDAKEMELMQLIQGIKKSQLVEDCTKKVAAARVSRREFPPRDFNQYIAPQGRNFKMTREPLHRNPEVGDFPIHLNVKNCGRLMQDMGKRPESAQISFICNQCGKNHGNRPYQIGSNVCYFCGELGHIAKTVQRGLLETRLDHNGKDESLP